MYNYIKESNDHFIINHTSNSITAVFTCYNKDYGERKEIYFRSKDYLGNTNRLSLVIFDEVTESDIKSYQLKSHQLDELYKKTKQIYYFITPSLMKKSIYVVPTLGNADITEKFYSYYSEEGYREEIHAGLIFSKSLSEREINKLVNSDNKDEIEEYIKYKGKKYKLVEEN